jgi:uncharacterized protein YbaP (TraB family)
VVSKAIVSSRTVAVETIELNLMRDPVALKKLEGTLLAGAHDRATQLLSIQELALLEGLAVRRGLTRALARKLKPAVLALILDLPPCAAEPSAEPTYPDALVLSAARTSSIRVVGLETLAEQIESLDGLPPDVQRKLLLAVIRQADRAEDIATTSLARYKEGNTGLLLSWMRSPDPLPGVESADTPSAFLDRLVDDRNRRMRDRLLPLLARGRAFVAVGAAHIPGHNGLANLFQQAGYHVEVVE